MIGNDQTIMIKTKLNNFAIILPYWKYFNLWLNNIQFKRANCLKSVDLMSTRNCNEIPLW